MGLDMYVVKVDGNKIIDDFSFKGTDDTDFFYWRKHPNLHGWMRNLYMDKKEKADEWTNVKPGTDTYIGEEFNGVYVRLEMRDILSLEDSVINNELPETTGFFFGKSTKEDKFADLQFIEKAKIALEEGKALYYSSSW